MEIKSLRETQKQKEQEIRTFYNKKMENLEEAVNRQKQANEEANKRALLKINMQQDEIKILQREYNIINHEKDRQQQKIQAIITSKDELENMLQNKDMEIECHIQKHDINTHKIKELQKQVQDLTDLENEYVSTQEEYRHEIEDLKNSLNSQNHNENILSRDLENAREEIKNLKLEITKNTQENIQAETSGSTPPVYIHLIYLLHFINMEQYSLI